jgi:hypothetical protein
VSQILVKVIGSSMLNKIYKIKEKKNMLILGFFFLLISFPGTINHIDSTCVLDSDFGFIINCNFKKSSLFRVRNLGGLKAHFGLGKVHVMEAAWYFCHKKLLCF